MRILTVAGVLAIAAPGEATAAPTPTPTVSADAQVPVRGSTVLTASREATGARATVLVNGLRRIPGATVLYFSVGLPAGEDAGWASLTHIQQDRRYDLVGSSLLGNAVVVDMAGKKVYSVLVDAEQKALASPTVAWTRATGGQFFTLYEVLPELPAALTSVDVLIGNADVIHDVPVESGLLEPAVEQTGPLPMGSGWPRIDPAAAANSLKPENAVRTLTTRTADIEETVVERETPDSVSVDLSADVLFASDSAKLGSKARAKVQKAADQINSRGAGGRIQVTGYTDNVGSSAHGDVLSKQRAASVAKVLKPLVTLSGVTYVLKGRGERDPVATNKTAAGRKLNRRVTVTFTPKAGQ